MSAYSSFVRVAISTITIIKLPSKEIPSKMNKDYLKIEKETHTED